MAPAPAGAPLPGRRAWRRCCLAALFGLCHGLVDESGNYQKGGDLAHLVPPEPTDEDRNAAVDLSKQPVEKLFRLLAFELMREEKRPPERRLGVREFQVLSERTCAEKLVDMAQGAAQVAEEVRVYHLNVTGTAGLFWLLHEYPEEHSWVWVISVSHERMMRKVGHHFLRLLTLAFDDPEGCLSPNFRTALMNSAATWRKLQADHTALVWNGVAFGLLGDVTSWRDVDEESGQAANEPGGPPPNVSWSENLIFGNMWVASVQKFAEYHAGEVHQAAYSELARANAGFPPDGAATLWQHGQGGALSSFEFLRRQLFSGWALDKGLLRGFLRHCLRPGYGDSAKPTVGDFGAGGGRYSEWLNQTGLVEAFAFDAAHAVVDITGGAVQQADFAADVRLFRTFDWVLSVDLGGFVNPEGAGVMLRNVRRHAEHGLVISWADPQAPGLLNPLPEDGFIKLVEAETGFRLDASATAALRAACEAPHLARGVAVFRPAARPWAAWR